MRINDGAGGKAYTYDLIFRTFYHDVLYHFTKDLTFWCYNLSSVVGKPNGSARLINHSTVKEDSADVAAVFVYKHTAGKDSAQDFAVSVNDVAVGINAADRPAVLINDNAVNQNSSQESAVLRNCGMACGNKETYVGARGIGNFVIAFNATKSFAASINSISTDTDTVSGYLASGLNNAALEVCNITYD